MQIRILDFKEENDVQVTTVTTENVDHSSGYYTTTGGSLMDSYILHKMFNPVLGITAYNVWKYDTGTLSLYHHIKDIDNFVLFPISEGIIRSIETVLFYQDHFIISARMSLRDEIFCPDGIAYFYTMGIMIVNKSGEMLRKVMILEYDGEHIIDMFFFENKFLFRVDETVYIFNTRMNVIFDKEISGNNMMKYEDMTDVQDREVLLFSKLEMSKVKLFYQLDGTLRLKHKRLNFWRH